MVEAFPEHSGIRAIVIADIDRTSTSCGYSVPFMDPSGKAQLTEEVLRKSGESYRQLVEAIVTSATDPAIAMSDAFAGAAAVLASTDYIDPCPIGTIAREVANTHPELREVANSIISSWVETVSTIFEEAGIASDRASSLARLAVASIEGGFIMARSSREVDAFIGIGEALRDAVQAELDR